uniref:Uncharacterized protein n=1 Tax=Oncorhynchus tshawytscha TaxID=74940 RepID=A0A8C8I1U6_ONCTS
HHSSESDQSKVYRHPTTLNPPSISAIVFLTLQQRETTLKKERDDYEDILEERMNSSDLKYAFGCYSPVLYKGLTPCNANMLKNIAYSDQLRYVINQVVNILWCCSPVTSYMDFPLMSYILYTYDLALPVIIGAESMGAEGAAGPLEKSE